MANIPLVQVPNAPQTGNTAVMTDPSAIRTPNFRRGGAIIAEGVNMLRQEKLPAAAFDAGGMGAGLESLGNAGSNAAAAFGDFAVRLGRANDEAQMATLDGIKSELVSKFEEKALTTPADQLEPLWQKFDAEFADRASKLPMSSPLGASKRDMAVKSMRLNMAAEVRGKANKARVDSYRNSLSAQMERQLTMGDTEGASATNAKMLNLGLLDQGDHDRNDATIFKANKQKVDAEMWGNIESDIMAHSQNAAAENYYDISNDLKEAIASKSYKSKFFPELDGEPASLRKTLTMVEQYERDGMIDRYNEAITRVAAGEYGTEDEFRSDYGDRLEPTLLGKAIDAFNQSPEEQSKRIAQRPALVTAIDMYDPVTDTNSKEFDKLLGWIHSMPAGYQADLSQMLRDKKKDAQPKPSSALQAIKEREKTLFDEGKYGPVKDDEQWQAAKALQSRVIDKLDSWARANPQQAADALEVSKKHNEIKTQIYQEDLADDNQSNMTKPQPVDPSDLSRRILQDPRMNPRADSRMQEDTTLDDVQLPLGDGSWRVTDKTRDEIRGGSRVGQRQVSLDFNDSSDPTSRRVEIVIPYNATKEERAAAEAYVKRTTEFFRSKGVNVPEGRVLTKTGSGKAVSRFHTEPFFAKDSDSFRAMKENPDEYAAILEDTLGRVANVTFIAPHRSDDGGAQNDETNERDFARNYLIPALQRRKGEAQLASND